MTSTSQTPANFKKWGGLLVLSLALAIIIIDGTVLNVSIGYLIRDLKTDMQHIQWVITSYSLVLAALTITGGRLGDFFGRKKMFMLGAVLFAIGSLIASLSTNVGTLLVGWSVVEGMGAALMMPATASLLISNFHGKERAMAFGIWGGVAGAAAAFGPILGGYLTTNYSWHWAFRINIVFVMLLLLGSVLISESIDKKEKRQLDIVGVLLSALGLTTLVYAFIESSTYGWWIAKKPFALFSMQLEPLGLSVIPFVIVIALMILALFVAWELRREKMKQTPLVSMRIFLNKQFAVGLITTSVLTLGQSGLIFSIPIFLQAVRGLDAFHTGLALLPMSLTLLISAPVGAILSHKFLPKRIIQLGLLVNLAAIVVLHASLRADATVWQLAPGLVLFGLGMGLVMAQITNITLSAVDTHMAGEASGINNTTRQIGQTLGSAIIGAIFISMLATNVSRLTDASAAIPALIKPTVIERLSNSGSSFDSAVTADEQKRLSPETLTEIMRIKDESMAQANRSALLVTSIFTLLCLALSTQLPKVKASGRSHGAVGGH